jgi:prophage DNA circulation protein
MPTPVLRDASYRGVRFFVQAFDDDTGRRLSVDSISGRDLPLVIDFGKEPRTLSFDAFVMGERYLDKALALIDACADRSTPGKLQLPNHQNLIVRPSRCVRREGDERGMARFQLSFVEVELLAAPMRRTSGLQALDRAAALVASAGVDAMAETLAVVGVPNNVLTAGGDEVAKIGAALAAVNTAKAAVEKATSLANAAVTFLRDAQALVLEPVALASQLSAAYELVLDTAGDALASLYAYQTLESLRPSQHSAYLQTANADLVSGAGRRCALAGWARAAGRVKWESYEDAIAARRALELAIDDQAGQVSDGEYLALMDLRARLAQQVPPANVNLPRLRRVVLPRATSSITLAYRLYDDTTRAEEIAARNHVKHPAFLPGNVDLQVLTGA